MFKLQRKLSELAVLITADTAKRRNAAVASMAGCPGTSSVINHTSSDAAMRPVLGYTGSKAQDADGNGKKPNSPF